MNNTDTNKVLIAGKIINTCKLSHESYGEKFYEFDIEVPRLSKKVDILPVLISDRLIKL